MQRLILASGSPRRRQLLEWLGLEFEVVVPEVEELTQGDDPESLVLENAKLKALAGRERAGARPGLVLGADTDVFLSDQADPIGKPEDAAGAERSLRMLSGRSHLVISGICLLPMGEDEARERSGVAASRVTFRELDDTTIGTYLRSEEWRGRAGGYAIQGLGSFLVEKLEGDFSNVVGLPLRLLLALAPEFGENTNPKV